MLLHAPGRPANRSDLPAGIDRRAFLQVGASSVLGLSLADLLRARAAAPHRRRRSRSSSCGSGAGRASSTPATPSRTPRSTTAARSPPSPRGSPASASASCSRNSPTLTDKLAIIRSLHTQSNDHGVAGTIGLTGSGAGGIGLDGKPLPGSPRPALGSVVGKARAGSTRPRLGHPFFVVGGKLHQGKKAIIGEGGGPLGAAYDPFRLEYDPADGHEGPRPAAADDLTPERLADRQKLLDAFGRAESRAADLAASRPARRLPRPGARDAHLADAAAAFDLSREKPADDRPLRPHALRPVVPARPAAGRGAACRSCR